MPWFAGPPSSSFRPFGTTRPTRRRSATSCSFAGAFIRQVSAGVWTFLPLGWRVHEKIVQIIREEMDAIGSQEMLMPVLTPAELWQATGRYKIAGGLQAPRPQRPRVRAAADARGDRHLPRAGDPVVPRPAADALPLPDEGSRRAAAARGADPRPRVHHEGLVLVRPRRGGARPRASSCTRARTTGSSSAAASRSTPSRPSPG